MAAENRVDIVLGARDDGSAVVDQFANRTEQALNRVGAGSRNAAEGTNALFGSLTALQAAALGFNQLLEASQNLLAPLQAIVKLSDDYANFSARLQNVTGSQEAANAVMEELVKITEATHAPLSSTVELYARLGVATKSMGVPQQDLLKFTEATNNALLMNGTRSSEAAGAMVQLSQALGSGALRSEEFNSVNEQMPAILDAVAVYLGRARGELKAMAAEGQLTTSVVLQSVIAMGDSWKKSVAILPVTLERALTDVGTAWQKYLGQNEAVRESSKALAAALEGIATHMDQIVPIAAAAGGSLAALKVMKAIGLDATLSSGAMDRFTASLHSLRTGAGTSSAALLALAEQEAATAAIAVQAAQRRAGPALADLRIQEMRLDGMKEMGLWGERMAIQERHTSAARAENAAASAILTEAEIRQTAATRALASAQAGATITGRVMTSTMAGLNTVLGALGGWAGVIMMAVTALGIWYTTSKKTVEETKDLTTALQENTVEWKNMSKEQQAAARLAAEESRKQAEALKVQIGQEKQAVEAKAQYVHSLEMAIQAMKETGKGIENISTLEEFAEKNRADLTLATDKLAESQDQYTLALARSKNVDLTQFHSALVTGIDAATKAMDRQKTVREADLAATKAWAEVQAKRADLIDDEKGAIQAALVYKEKALEMSRKEAIAAKAAEELTRAHLASEKALLAYQPELAKARTEQLATMETLAEKQREQTIAAEAKVAADKDAVIQSQLATKTFGDQSAQLENLRAQYYGAAANLEALEAQTALGAKASWFLEVAQRDLAKAQGDLKAAQESGGGATEELAKKVEVLKQREYDATLQVAYGVEAAKHLESARNDLTKATALYEDALNDAVAASKRLMVEEANATTELERGLALRNTLQDNRITEIKTRAELARAIGDETEAVRLEAEATRLETEQKQAVVDQAKLVAAAKWKEHEAASAYLETLTEQANRNKDLSDSEKVAIEAARANAEAKKAEAEAASEVARHTEEQTNANNELAEAAKKSAAEQQAAKEKAEEAAKVYTDGVAAALLSLKSKYSELGEAATGFLSSQEEINKAWKAFKDGNSNWYWADLTAAMDKALASHRSMVQAQTDLAAGLDAVQSQFETGAISLPQYIDQMEYLEGTYHRLGDEDLSDLRSALADARELSDELAASAKSALSAALSAAQEAGIGFTKIEQENLDWAETLADLQAQLAEAQAASNTAAIADLQRAIDLQTQAHNQRIKDLQTEYDAWKLSNSGSSGGTDTTDTGQVDSGGDPIIRESTGGGGGGSNTQAMESTSTQTVKIQLEAANQTAELFADEQNAAAMIAVLQQAQKSSTGNVSMAF